MATVQQQMKQQQMLVAKEAKVAKVAQATLTKQLEDAQKTVQATTSMSQHYEEQLTALSQKMATLERILIEQRQKGQQLESELSSAQDRIGGAKRRAHLLEAENVKIKGELQSWNDYYNQEGTSPEEPVSTVFPPFSAPSATASLFNFTSPLQMDYSALGSNMPMSQPLSGPSLTTLAVSTSMPVVESTG